MSQFVIIQGRTGGSPKEIEDYIAHIVYGTPLIRAVKSDDRFAAFVEYDSTSNAAKYTFERMGSFSHGASYHLDREVALREFGVAVFRILPSLDTAGCADA